MIKSNVGERVMNSQKQNIIEYVEQNLLFYKGIGLKVLQAQKGYVKCSVPLKEETISHLNTIHAAVQFSLAESIGGIIAGITFGVVEYYPVVKEGNIRFLQRAESDLTTEAKIDDSEINRIQTETDQIGKSEFTISCELKNEADGVVATFTGIYQLRKSL